jgi:hypothetical protein
VGHDRNGPSGETEESGAGDGGEVHDDDDDANGTIDDDNDEVAGAVCGSPRTRFIEQCRAGFCCSCLLRNN